MLFSAGPPALLLGSGVPPATRFTGLGATPVCASTHFIGKVPGVGAYGSVGRGATHVLVAIG